VTRFWNILGGIVAVGTIIVLPAYVHNPSVWQHIGVGVATAQAIGSIIAHSYNPDGTPAAAPYQPSGAEKFSPKDYQEEETRN
jgi:hypothetical protein